MKHKSIKSSSPCSYKNEIKIKKNINLKEEKKTEMSEVERNLLARERKAMEREVVARDTAERERESYACVH